MDQTFEELQKRLQKELEKYPEKMDAFKEYYESMKDISAWLESKGEAK